MEQNKIPVIINSNQTEVVGAMIIFTEDFEKRLLHGFKNRIPFRLGGAVDVSKDKIVSLSISLDIK